MRYKNLEEFITKMTVVYEGEFDYELEESASNMYSRAKEDVRGWVRKKMLERLTEADQVSEMKESFILPHGRLSVEVRIGRDDLPLDIQGAVQLQWSGDDLERRDWVSRLRYLFPYGEVDAFIHKAIIEEEGNPVEILYGYLKEQLDMLHSIADRNGCGGELLDENRLLEGDVHDILGIHSFEHVLRDFNAMLRGARDGR